MVDLFDPLLRHVEAAYELPEQDLVGEVLVPALTVAQSVDIAVGYFSSHSLTAIAPGLACLIDRDVTCRLLISPELSGEDRQAIERGYKTPDEVIEAFLAPLVSPETALAAHSADCLAWLVATRRLDIRCVLMDAGMYHKKVWLLSDGQHRLAVHGSGNLTARGLFVNGEQMTVDRPWMDGQSSEQRVDRFFETFGDEWNNRRAGRLAIKPTQLLSLLEHRGQDRRDVPTIQDFWDAWREETRLGTAPPLPPGAPRPPSRLRIPDWLDWQHPPYAHQAEAIGALRERSWTTVLQIATGGGKTKTAMVAASLIQDEQEPLDAPLIAVVIAPTTVLVGQWASEVRDFGVAPVVLSGLTPDQRRDAYTGIELRTASGGADTTVIVSTQTMFAKDQELQSLLGRVGPTARTLLIADEAHNLGAPGFINDPPDYFDYRIGLSATPIRQYDAVGTDALLRYFDSPDGPAFEFSLSDAIASGCLTPYDYHVYLVEFTDDEMEQFDQYTTRIIQAAGNADDEGADLGSLASSLSSELELLLRRRRALVEQAINKPAALLQALQPIANEVSHALIYCSAKEKLAPFHLERQIDLAREVLRQLDITTHMYTSVETASADRRLFLDQFGAGDLQSLLAMKVLDEGVDIPAAHSAYLLASSTVEREWVQRRGRVLRTAPGKTRAHIHDFVVTPPGGDGGQYPASLLRSEIRRMKGFREDAANAYDQNGPLATIHELEDILWGLH